MVNDVIKGIAKAIHTEYSDGYEIYDEKVKQGLKEPCFFISALKPFRKRIAIGRWQGGSQYVIRYHPKEDSRTECYTVGDRLYDVLEGITLLDGSIMIGSDMSYEVVDNILHFFVDYSGSLKTADEELDQMETLDTTIRSTNG